MQGTESHLQMFCTAFGRWTTEMASEKGHVEIPMVMYEQHQEPYRQEPSAPEYCSQEGKQLLPGGGRKERAPCGCGADTDSWFPEHN